METLRSRPQAMIVNVTSGLALAPSAGAPVYCATKAALRSYTVVTCAAQGHHDPRSRGLAAGGRYRDDGGAAGGQAVGGAMRRAIVDAMAADADEANVGWSKC
jgi:uncharacterized oxidoreductase